MRTMRRAIVALFVASLMTLAGAAVVQAQEPTDVALNAPIRSLELDEREYRADLDVRLLNFTDERRTVRLDWIGIPEGWSVAIWNTFYEFRITEFVVEPVPKEDAQRLNLRIDVPQDPPAPEDTYSFTLVVTDAEDPSVEYDRARFTVKSPPPAEKELGEVNIATDFPILRGPSSTQYEFGITVFNSTDEERVFNLAADVRRGSPTGPVQQGWELNFTPAFGQEKLVSSVSVRATNNERMKVKVTPPFFATPGDYFIPVTVESGEFSDATLLQLTVVGRGSLTMSTPTGQLNLDATAGQEATLTVRLGNVGTGELTNVALAADTPPEWQLRFDLDRVASLPRDNIIDIPVHIKPPDDAVPGDYVVTLRGRSEASNASVAIRVTVEQSTIWGWLGILLVVLVLGGLGGLFWRLGRR